MSEAPRTPTEPPGLRFLRIMVTVLTVTMIGGLLTVIALLVIRVPQVVTVTEDVPFPDAITLPDGATAAAFTQTADWYAIVTSDGEILVYNRDDNTLIQRITITKP